MLSWTKSISIAFNNTIISHVAFNTIRWIQNVEWKKNCKDSLKLDFAEYSFYMDMNFMLELKNPTTMLKIR